MAVKITFRPTTRQVLGRALFLSGLSLFAALVPAVAYMLAVGHWYHYTLLALFLFAIGVALGAAYAGARGRGVVLDERGIHPLKAVASQKHTERFAAWTDIADIRAERRASRTVPVVYLLDPEQKPWRLQAPYSGRVLSTDDELDEKIFVMRSIWDAYKRGLPPYRQAP
ncbi:hypothetical protein [Glycomyces algeriensis]|uniref:hypothetical protein n=1 Tax=Glycomyces algeriensis TaxID=256037 RepID=UPI0022D4ADE6|nr:hypothetical protein [Glycomyces algeriensis]MDA1366787.1 hypothetical protein [Glycomyces algeriensis]MDA1368638.1 hypothetical protein [Glycomyces algeriensis]